MSVVSLLPNTIYLSKLYFLIFKKNHMILEPQEKNKYLVISQKLFTIKHSYPVTSWDLINKIFS